METVTEVELIVPTIHLVELLYFLLECFEVIFLGVQKSFRFLRVTKMVLPEESFGLHLRFAQLGIHLLPLYFKRQDEESFEDLTCLKLVKCMEGSADVVDSFHTVFC